MSIVKGCMLWDWYEVQGKYLALATNLVSFRLVTAYTGTEDPYYITPIGNPTNPYRNTNQASILGSGGFATNVIGSNPPATGWGKSPFSSYYGSATDPVLFPDNYFYTYSTLLYWDSLTGSIDLAPDYPSPYTVSTTPLPPVLGNVTPVVSSTSSSIKVVTPNYHSSGSNLWINPTSMPAYTSSPDIEQIFDSNGNYLTELWYQYSPAGHSPYTEQLGTWPDAIHYVLSGSDSSPSPKMIAPLNRPILAIGTTPTYFIYTPDDYYYRNFKLDGTGGPPVAGVNRSVQRGLVDLTKIIILPDINLDWRTFIHYVPNLYGGGNYPANQTLGSQGRGNNMLWRPIDQITWAITWTTSGTGHITVEPFTGYGTGSLRYGLTAYTWEIKCWNSLNQQISNNSWNGGTIFSPISGYGTITPYIGFTQIGGTVSFGTQGVYGGVPW